MHVDYAIEQYKKLKFPKFVNAKKDIDILVLLAKDEIVDYCEKNGNEKIQSVAKTMKESYGYRSNSCFIKKKITEKQRYVIAEFLIEKFSTAKDAICEIYGVDSQYFESVEV